MIDSAKKINFIMSATGLNRNQISEILGVMHTSVGRWVMGFEPRRKNVIKIDRLYEISKLWKEKKAGHFNMFLYKRIEDGGMRLREILSNKSVKAKDIIKAFDKLEKKIKRIK